MSGEHNSPERAPRGAEPATASVVRLVVWASAGFVVGLVVVVLLVRKPGEPLTAENLAAARERWQRAGVEDYDLAVRVWGVQQGDYLVRVRGGRAVRATNAGIEVESATARAAWTVEGMFDALEQFLTLEAEAERGEHRRDAGATDAGAAGEGGAGGAAAERPATLRVQFDPDYGYPRYFLRHVTGTTEQIEWEVESLELR